MAAPPADSSSHPPKAPASILLDHGAGGRLSHELVSRIMLPAFDNPVLSRMDDGAVFEAGGVRFAFSTDSFVVDPIFFPGGNIGDLAVNGTVNDVAMCGAVPTHMSAAMIIEEGFSEADLGTIVQSMAAAARNAGVQIVTGDTKVVPRGAADKIYINTSGIGQIPEGVHVSANRARPGDRIIISGTIADHGMTIMASREGLSIDAPIRSDTAPLNHMVARMLAITKDIRTLRDPTRGGIAAALNEIAMAASAGIRIIEDHVPIKNSVAGLCEMLGLDPLYVANEGKLIAVVPEAHADALLSAIQQDPMGKDARIIGTVVSDHPASVVMETAIGGERIVDMPTGTPLPRIC